MGSTQDDLDAVLRARSVPVEYQPIVDLASGDVVAFEALARPHTDDPGGIVALLELAHAQGRLAEVDWICRTAALADPAIARLPPELVWFVNAEPRALDAAVPPDLVGAAPTARRRVVEITERAAQDDPCRLLRGVSHIRRSGAGVALDDVGGDPASLALLSIVAPDVVKLDRSLLDHPDAPRTTLVTDAVRAYAERSGATVLLEGVETAEHVEMARLLGARVGQGYRYGRPGPLPASLPTPSSPLRDRAGGPDTVAARSLFELFAEHHDVQHASRVLLSRVTGYMENQVEQHREPLALLTRFQHRRSFTPLIQKRYGELAGQYAFVATLGPDLPPLADVPVVRGAVPDGDAIGVEWTVVVLGPYYAVALSAREADHGPPDDSPARRYEYVVTHDRVLVELAARTLASYLDGGPDEHPSYDPVG